MMTTTMACEPNSADEDKTASSPTKFIPEWVKLFCIGAFIRVSFKTLFPNALMRRVELVNPLTSWYRMQECIALSKFNILPYEGDICHHPPLVIYFFRNFCNTYVPFFFTVADLLIAIVLYNTARTFTVNLLKSQATKKPSYAADCEVLLFDENQLKNVPLTVMSFYLFNPFSITTCQAQSTEVINNLAMSLVLLTMTKHYYVGACLFIAVSAYLSFYPIMLLVPVLLHVAGNSSSRLYDVSKYLVLTVTFCFGMMICSYSVYESWSFIHAVYGFILEAPDLTPNMGLFWYFFAEMFDHFRLFFQWVYQINTFIYVVPVAVIFRKNPMMVSYTLLSLIALFKSYSNVGSLTLPLALLPLWSYTFRYMRNILLVSAFLFVTPVLIPGMWYLWIYAGSGNANFFYAVTLAYGTGHVFLLSDVLYAFLRYEFHLIHGLDLKTDDGKVGTPVLK